MNIMLVSVSERVREIGLRKAVGAKRINILSQFLVETVVIALGVVYLVLGGALAIGLLWKPSSFRPAWSLWRRIYLVIIGLLSSL